MSAVAELVHALHLLYFVTVPHKEFKVPCECCRITAYIHDSLRCHLDHGVKQCLITTLSWGVNYNNIGIYIFFVIF